MSKKDAYLDIVDRSLAAAQAAATTHEKAVFLAYHAFESLGGGLFVLITADPTRSGILPSSTYLSHKSGELGTDIKWQGWPLRSTI